MFILILNNPLRCKKSKMISLVGKAMEDPIYYAFLYLTGNTYWLFIACNTQILSHFKLHKMRNIYTTTSIPSSHSQSQSYNNPQKVPIFLQL